MNSSIILNEADKTRLEMLLNGLTPPPLPDPPQQLLLREILAAATVPRRGHVQKAHAGFHDRITLVSPRDSRDFFKFSIVMPRDADVDEDLISVLTPLSLAVIGRACGQSVTWDVPAGPREMRIISIEKADTPESAAMATV